MFGSPARCQRGASSQPARGPRQTHGKRMANARATVGRRSRHGWGGSVMPRGPRKTHGKRSSDGRPTLAPRMGGVSDAARPAENAGQTLERRSADARATDRGDGDCDAARRTHAPPRSDCSNRLRIVAEPSSELRVGARILQTVSLIVTHTHFSQIVSKLSSNFFAVWSLAAK